MRSLMLVVAGLILTTSLSAQKNKEPLSIPKLPTNSESGLISYVKVVDVATTSKTELYNRAFAWANSFYKNPGDVIREKNPEAGKMVIKARYKIYNEPADKKGVTTDAGDVMYTLTIEFKENRFRYEITKFNWQQVSAFPAERWMDDKSPSFNPAYASYLEQTDKKVKEITDSLEKRMKEDEKAVNQDW